MFVGIRLPEETVAAIDAEARSLGTTRSGWIAHAIAKRLDGSLPVHASAGRPRRLKGDAQVHFRMSAEELRQVEAAAKKIGLTRTEFFIASARGRVWRDQAVIKHSPETKEAFREAIRQLHAVGVNLNQVVKVLRGALTEGNDRGVGHILEKLITVNVRLDDDVENVLHAMYEHLNAEQDGWRWR